MRWVNSTLFYYYKSVKRINQSSGPNLNWYNLNIDCVSDQLVIKAEWMSMVYIYMLKNAVSVLSPELQIWAITQACVKLKTFCLWLFSCIAQNLSPNTTIGTKRQNKAKSNICNFFEHIIFSSIPNSVFIFSYIPSRNIFEEYYYSFL